jgi:tyrosinase
VLRDIEPPKDPKTRVRVYINREGLLPNTRMDDPHYVTSLSFFGTEHMDHSSTPAPTPLPSSSSHSHHSHHGMSSSPTPTPVAGGAASIDLTAALARLSGTRYFRSDKLVVQLQPVCPGGDTAGSAVRARRVEIAVI